MYFFYLVSLSAVLVFLSDASSIVAQEPFVRILAPHEDLVRWVGYSPDGKILASNSFDKTIRLRDAVSGNVIHTLNTDQSRNVWGSFSKDSKAFCTGSMGYEVRSWDVASGEGRHLWTFSGLACWGGDITATGTLLAVGSPEKKLKLRVLPNGTETGGNVDSPVWWLKFHPKEHEIAVACEDGQVRIINVRTLKERLRFGNHRGGIYAVTYSPDGTLIATAGMDNRVGLWDSSTGSQRASLPHFAAVHAVAFSPDGVFLATGGADANIKLWNTRTGSFVRKLAGHNDAVWSVNYSPDGKHLASGSADKQVMVWNPTYRALTTPPKPPLPKQVDLRPKFREWNLIIVPQKSRNSCSVHTFTRAMEFAVSKHTNQGTRLSDEYMNWACNQLVKNTSPDAKDRGQFFEHLWMSFLRFGVCSAEEMPWQVHFGRMIQPSPTMIQKAMEMKSLQLRWHDIGGFGNTTTETVRQIKTVLAAGYPVLAGSTHSVLIVGYQDDSRQLGGGYFIIADSGTGGFVTTVTSDRLHSAITYQRVNDYGFSWIVSEAK